MSAELIEGLRARANEDELTRLARAAGFLSFADDAMLKARQGQTALTEVYRIAGALEAADET
jgi:type II secretory ATPase GspE/PulE/Tfp pilus assembly ATPase PilB-like protein